ncbi:hypothetical protein BM536_028560 [Streptomyces phaeoluteigriseus]|uniref:Uncharacterized protein n=1 Tax=Streptomyces phaeoluteigriseus TaxID=114686 RepID=A0A1V6MMH4_9ACTN|nr:hypothetical protein BM536_028560 [Streptomyces phaeoluteigriseus]
MDSTSLFSAPEGAPRSATATSPPPTANPFQAPDFGDFAEFAENENFPPEDGPEFIPESATARRRRAG